MSNKQNIDFTAKNERILNYLDMEKPYFLVLMKKDLKNSFLWIEGEKMPLSVLIEKFSILKITEWGETITEKIGYSPFAVFQQKVKIYNSDKDLLNYLTRKLKKRNQYEKTQPKGSVRIQYQPTVGKDHIGIRISDRESLMFSRRPNGFVIVNQTKDGENFQKIFPKSRISSLGELYALAIKSLDPEESNTCPTCGRKIHKTN